MKRELAQLCDGQDSIGMQRPMTLNTSMNWQGWLFSFFKGSATVLREHFDDGKQPFHHWTNGGQPL